MRPGAHTAARGCSYGHDRRTPGSPSRVRPGHRARDDPWRQMARHGIEQGDAERLDVRTRFDARIDPELVMCHQRGLVGVLGGEVSVRSRDDARDGPGGRQHSHLLRLELLVPQRVRRSGPIRWTRR